VKILRLPWELIRPRETEWQPPKQKPQGDRRSPAVSGIHLRSALEIRP